MIDQDPVPTDLQTWTGATFAFYWFSDLITVSGWSAASSIMTTGLSSTDAILITLCAGICNAIPTVLNGAIGSDLHIAFPIAIRASYGYWFSYFCVISRGILALFWFGVQSAYGGACVTPVGFDFHYQANNELIFYRLSRQSGLATHISRIIYPSLRGSPLKA